MFPFLAVIASVALADPALSREDLVAEVLAANAAVDAASHAVDAARARVKVRGAWPDPRVGVSLAPLSIGAPDMPTGVAVEASQTIPLSGRLALDRTAARIEAAIAEQDLAEVRLELALAASRLYDDYWLVDRALELNEAHRALVAELEESARARYVVGRAPEAAPLAAELELLRLERQAIALEADRQATIAALNGLLHRPTDAPLAAPAAPDDPPPEEAAVPGVDGRPDLAALAAAEDLAEVRERAARRLWIPEPMLMSEYSTMWMDEEHRWMVGVAVDVPLQIGARRGAVDAARADRARAEADRLHAEAEAEVEVRRAWLDAEAARRAFQLYDARLRPVAADRLRASRIAFEADRADFDALIEAERELLSAELGALSAAADYHRASAALAVATGEIPGASR